MENRQDVIDYLVSESEGDYTEQNLQNVSDYVLFKRWLEWQGIIGFTDDIIEVAKALNVCK